MGKKRVDLFWASYADLMTSLFFVMLVLFVVSIIVLNNTTDDASTQIAELNKQLDTHKKENAELKEKIIAYEKQLDNIQTKLDGYIVREQDYLKMLNLENTFKSLSENGSLRYDDYHKTFIAKDFEGIEIFEPGLATIKPMYYTTVDKVGKDLHQLLEELNNEGTESISYLLVIEGNTANTWDFEFGIDHENSYILSYRRALALYKRWQSIGINLRQYNTEIQICGSGMNGINRDAFKEENNKRFVIQIIPKMARSY